MGGYIPTTNRPTLNPSRRRSQLSDARSAFQFDEANALDDADTADLFTEVSRGIDKWLWFVEAHSQASK